MRPLMLEDNVGLIHIGSCLAEYTVTSVWLGNEETSPSLGIFFANGDHRGSQPLNLNFAISDYNLPTNKQYTLTVRTPTSNSPVGTFWGNSTIPYTTSLNAYSVLFLEITQK
jgi:hypothetical protein